MDYNLKFQSELFFFKGLILFTNTELGGDAVERHQTR